MSDLKKGQQFVSFNEIKKFKVNSLALKYYHHFRNQLNTLAPNSIKDALWNHLSLGDSMEFEEIAIAWQQLQTDASDLLATLKYHKIMILEVCLFLNIFANPNYHEIFSN